MDRTGCFYRIERMQRDWRNAPAEPFMDIPKHGLEAKMVGHQGLRWAVGERLWLALARYR